MPAELREAVIDLAAIRSNVGVLKERSGQAGVMAVVKADAYGHGLIPAARAAQAGGAQWLGVALLQEAIELRAAGIEGPILAWLLGRDEDLIPAVRADIDLSQATTAGVERVAAAAASVGRPARIQLKVDTGLGRGGCPPDDWADVVDTAHKAEIDGFVRVVGIWSHMAYADAPGHPMIDQQLSVFVEAVRQAEAGGLRPDVRHLANSAATLTRPDTHFDLTRPGLSVYGLSPIPDTAPAADLGLQPAMTLTAQLVLVKRVPSGHGVSYTHQYVTPRATSLGLVPLGYADGIPRNATNIGPVQVGGRRRTVAGVVCMDQFVIDLENDDLSVGDEVVLFGRGPEFPTAEDWAAATGTISYEIITRIGPRVLRRYVGDIA